MKRELVAAFATNEITGTAPDWIMFAPAGKQQIQAKLDGKPSRLTITVDAEGAAALQRDLEARKAEGGPQPFFDLHHDAREAAAYPQEFEWREGSGIWARVIWTPMGLEATKCDPAAGILPSVRYFSPRCAVVRGRIAGLLDSSSGNAAGGLVSDPAFEKIAPLVAAKTQTQQDNMDKKRLMKALGKAEDAEMEDEDLMIELEAACAGYMKGKDMEAGMAKKMDELTASKAVVESEVANLRSELQAARAELGKAKEAEADSFVRELVASGKIPAKAQGTQKVWRSSYLADAASAIEASKELQAAHAPSSERLTNESNPSASDSLPLADRIEKRAQELQASKSLSRETAYAEAQRELLK